MIQEFVTRFDASREALREQFAAKHPESYEAIVKMVVSCVGAEDNQYESPDPERIHQIDDGEYQGTLVFVVAGHGYSPDNYWYVKVSYGSCSGCDTLERIRGYSDQPPTPQQVDEYMTLALHVVQEFRPMQ